MVKVHVVLKSGAQAIIQLASMEDVDEFHAQVLTKRPGLRRWRGGDDSLIAFSADSVEMYNVSNDYLKRG